MLMEIRQYIGSLLIALFAGCAQPELRTPVIKLAMPQTEQACASAHGMWGPVGLFRNNACALKSTDAGKRCVDSSQCQAVCLGPQDALHGSNVTGSCSASWLNFGNVVEVENGKAIRLQVE